MVYKALVEIGGYKPGDTVPDDKALVWLEQYAVPQVEKVTGKEKPKEEPKPEPEKESKEEEKPDSEKEEPKGEPEEKEEGKPEEKEEAPPEGESKEEGSSIMIDDYLDRNGNVVKHNVKTDNLDKQTLEKLLEHEEKDKKRSKVIKILKHKLRGEKS